MTASGRRPLLRLTGAAAIAALTLTGCAGTGSADDAGASGDGPVETLTFWSNHPGESKEVETELLEAFEAETGIEVNLVTAGKSYEEVAQKFNAALSGGELPDVVVASDVTWFNFALTDAITPMDELWEAGDVDSEGYVDSLREDYAFEGEHYALPYARSTPLFYYNKAMWSAAGLPDRGPATWDEWAEWAPKLAAANAGIAPMVLPDGSNYLDWYFQGMVWTFGGSYSDEWDMTFTSDETIEAGTFLQDQYRQEHIAVSNDANNQFGAGQAAALMQSTGSLKGLTSAAQFDIGTAFLPGPPPGCPTGGAGLAIPERISDERKEAALQLIEFLTSTDNTVTFSQATGYMPVQKDAVDHPDMKPFLDSNPNFRTALEQLDVTSSQDYARVLLPGGGARIGAGLDRITIGGEDVAKVFGELDEESRTVYERDIEPKL
ncbi:sn-glycerol 3-phosphate transport system substrate-binding protein [Blastococcus aggregatus]|uniref:sn-glycerol 3-phosphate transport system substrate-binding protein n=1 Tax=Blastococcus aggregatus TaxID=38502 RepID=A0A285VHP8_9ACTN|nr:ABC transporter substrate-binding protein [Blastococcus aggregatus]SOC52706.1 sn-glycerol 3-phosphate transport system substrate-binding protein [Blastococcus aggregatus]